MTGKSIVCELQYLSTSFTGTVLTEVFNVCNCNLYRVAKQWLVVASL